MPVFYKFLIFVVLMFRRVNFLFISVSIPGNGTFSFSDIFWDHPSELKKLLVGELSQEMTVKVRRSREMPFKTLTHRDCDPNFEQVKTSSNDS